MTQTQHTVRAAYADAGSRLRAVLEAAPAEGWASPSPCEGWSAGDVVVHLVDAQRDFLTGRGLDLGERPDVAADPAAAWREHVRAVADVLADGAVTDEAFDGFFGPTTVGETFERFYVWDTVVHRWDVARAVGADTVLDDSELDRVERGADGFGEALHLEGICRPSLDAPADASRQARVLARLGRQV